MNDQKQLALSAFEEGFLEGCSHECNNWKYPPQNIAWLESQARKDAGFPPLTGWQEVMIEQWYNSKINEQRDASPEVIAK